MASGTICRYYANGFCRFGSSCWNIHESPPDSRSRTFKNSTNHAQQGKSQGRRSHFKQSDVQELVDLISEEAKQVEYGHMWPLTCPPLVANIQHVTGWDDFSMEELRHLAYLAKSSGEGASRFNEYVEYANKLKQKAKENRWIFLKPGQMAHDLARKMLEDRREEPKVRSFSQNSSFSNSGGSLGSNSFDSIGTSGFSSGGSVFGLPAKDPAPGLFTMAAQGFKSSPFSQSFSQGNESINDTAMETAHDFSVNFTQPAASSSFHQNVFGAVPSPASSPNTNLFSSSLSAVNPFDAKSTANPSNGNPFGANSTNPSTGNPFGANSTNPSTGNPFGAALPAPAPDTFPGFGSVQPDGDPAFTPFAELTDAELEQFKATTFTLHNLPLKPPPQELC